MPNSKGRNIPLDKIPIKLRTCLKINMFLIVTKDRRSDRYYIDSNGRDRIGRINKIYRIHRVDKIDKIDTMDKINRPKISYGRKPIIVKMWPKKG